jgi:Tol biopolymer transport system component
MTIATGTRLGSYEVVAAIGAGGMGEVYRAHDTKLGRDVAIKVLPPNFVNDPERLSRFQREARMLAALNHANIATIYGLEQCDGVTCLVMELVSGETLAERVRSGPIGIEEALKIAVQIAEAMEAAHEKSIIHRDLKPANVKVTPEGKVKVLDFGLAKAFAGDAANDDPSNSPTLSAAATMQGVILGTAGYMSPEQARGKPCDKRTDIWAFGCVLYELLTGKQAFQGETTTEILAAVLRGDPDWQALPSSTPAKIRDLLGRCLQKDLRRRLHDAADARIEIEEALAAPAKVEPATPAKRLRTLGWRELIIGIGALMLVAVVTGLAVWNLKPVPQRPVTRFAMSLPPGQRLDTAMSAIAISPDGTRLVYAAGPSNLTTQLYTRAMDGLEALPIPGTEGGGDPFYSPDGKWIGFSNGAHLMKVSLTGVVPVSLADTFATSFFGASWGSQGKIAVVLQAGGPIWQIPDTRGSPQPLTHLEKGEVGHRWPDFLPGGKGVLFMVLAGVNSKIVAQSLETGERRDLVQTGIFPRYAPSGHLIYLQGANLMAVPFDAQRLAITGAAVPVIEGVQSTGGAGIGGSVQYSFSSTGSLVYVPGSVQAASLKLVWVDRKGAEQPVGAPAHNFVLPRVSPDGRRVAVGIEEADSQIWLYDLGRDTLTRLTFEGSGNVDPVWTPDGKRVVFKGTGNRLFWQLADGSAGAEPLTSSELAGNNVPGSWSPDGQVLAFMEINPNTGYDVYTLPLKDGKPQPFVHTPSLETAPRFSPDGHFIAYVSDESGRLEVYVRPYPGPGGKWQISTEGGAEPVWNPKGRELFYRSGNKMMAVDIATQPTFSPGKPKMLFEGPYVPTPRSFPDYDVSPDGQRFLMLKANELAQAPAQINVVLNWFEELKQKVPTGK